MSKDNKVLANNFFEEGQNFSENGQFKMALEKFEAALKIDPNNKVYWNDKALAQCNLEKFKEAMDSIENALKIDDAYTTGWNNKGFILLKQGNLIEGLKACEEALKFDPLYAMAWSNKGYALNSLGKYTEGLTSCEKALKIDPNHKLALKNKSISFKGLTRYEDALIAIEKALEIDPDFSVAKNIKQECLGLIEASKNKSVKPKTLQFLKNLSDELPYPSLKKGDLQDETYLISNYPEHEIRLIGKGGFGKVFLVVSKNEGKKLAVKVIETNSLDVYKESLNELSNLEVLGSHPNIMTHLSYDLHQTKSKEKIFQIYLEMTFANFSLEMILHKNPSLLEEDIIHVLKEIFSGLKFAHENKVVHMDLKPDNILIVGDVCKLADWGGSFRLKSLQSTTIKSEFTATCGYSAPELEDENYCKQGRWNFYFCDIYSLGMVALRMCGFQVSDLRKINKGTKKYHDMYMEEEIFPILKTLYSEKIIGLIRKMTVFVPGDRITTNEAMNYLEKNF